MADLKITYKGMYQQFDYNTNKYITVDVKEKKLALNSITT